MSVVGQKGDDGFSGGQSDLQSSGVNRDSQVNQARCTDWMGAGGERESSVLLACEAGSAMHKVEPGTFSVNIKNIAICYKSIP